VLLDDELEEELLLEDDELLDDVLLETHSSITPPSPHWFSQAERPMQLPVSLYQHQALPSHSHKGYVLPYQLHVSSHSSPEPEELLELEDDELEELVELEEELLLEDEELELDDELPTL